ncbi:FAD:protein FMN transferase [Anatilimnocola floriformis]|uniref:FAD:protein FMN transferase n=1 Tax=Anatilimnocola floriformis TaxID=2948575 RepID=UPI0020C538AC|nr:FAD:protein FMN transferase [Anatilimnocola floriformis]
MVASPQLMIDVGAGVGLPGSKAERPLLINRSRPALGALFEVCLIGSDEEHLSSVAEACLAETQRLDRRLSRFSANSETSRINRDAARNAVIVDYELAELLTLCYSAWQRTEGWFDIASNQSWSIKNRQVEFLELGTQLDVGIVSKGYTLDRAAELVDEFNVADAILHAGTQTVLAKGNSLTGRGWQVRVRNPASDAQGAELLVELCDEALAVVTNHDRHLPADQQAAVLVTAPTAFEAEVFAAALLQMGRARALDFLSQQTQRVSVAWLDEVTFPHEGTWHWLTE